MDASQQKHSWAIRVAYSDAGKNVSKARANQSQCNSVQVTSPGHPAGEATLLPLQPQSLHTKRTWL